MADPQVNTAPRRARRGEGLRGPGYLIAASDSSKHYKDQAHTICPGTDDQDRIQFAIDNVGGLITLLPGNYSVKEDGTKQHCLVIDRDDVTFVLEQGAVLKLADGVYPSGVTGHVIRIGDGGVVTPPTLRRNIRIRGPGVIDGNRANNVGVGGGSTQSNTCININGFLDNITIGSGLIVKNAAGQGIGLTGVNVGGDPLSPYEVTRVRFEDLHLTGNIEGCLPNLVDGMFVDNLLIEDCISQDGWEPIGLHNLVMQNSIIRDTFGSAMDIFQGSAPSVDYGNLNHTYSNCIFGPNKSGGDVIAIGVGATGTTAQENILLANCVIDMGDGTGTGTIGIRIGDRGAGPTTSFTRRLTLDGCTIDGTASAAGSDGIVIADYVEDISIVNCVVFNCGRHGLRIDGGIASAPDQPTRILVSGGKYFNNGRDTAGGSGISVEQSDFVTIDGAECYDNQGTPTQDYGIDTADAATDPTDLVVRGCRLYGNQLDGIRYGPGARNEFSDNRGQVFETVDDTTDSHTGDTNFTTLKSRTIPGRLLETGRLIEIEAWGRRTGGVVSYDLRMLYGVVSSGEISQKGDTWWLKATLQHLGASSQRGFVQAISKGEIDIETLTSAVDDTVDLTLAIQVKLGAAGDTVFCDQIHWRLRN